MGPLLGHGIFNTDGAPWKFHRSMSRPFFVKEKIQHFQIFDRHANDAVGQIRDRLREGVPIDIQVRSLSCVCVVPRKSLQQMWNRMSSRDIPWTVRPNSCSARTFGRSLRVQDIHQDTHLAHRQNHIRRICLRKRSAGLRKP